MNQQTIQSYCDDKKITLAEFSRITGVSYSQLTLIKDNRRANPYADTIRRIYNGTKKSFGTPLDLWDYIDVDITN